MNALQKILIVAIVCAAGGAATYQARQISNLREQNRALQQQRALLTQEIEHFRRPRDETAQQSPGSVSNSASPLSEAQYLELLRLRGAVAVLKRQLAEATHGLKPGQSSETNQTKAVGLGDLPVIGQLFRIELNSTNAQGFVVPPDQIAKTLGEADPAAALAFSERLNPADRQRFLDSFFAAWAQKDTQAALQWVDGNLSDPAQKDAALTAIRSVAPVGIGAELRQQDGYAVINRTLPGSPAALSGQLQPGDRILAIAQADNTFVDARNLALGDLVQYIRGAPGTQIQLLVLPADAPPDSSPRAVTLTREQITYKR